MPDVKYLHGLALDGEEYAPRSPAPEQGLADITIECLAFRRKGARFRHDFQADDRFANTREPLCRVYRILGYEPLMGFTQISPLLKTPNALDLPGGFSDLT